jgi:general secretion pathway protein E
LFLHEAGVEIYDLLDDAENIPQAMRLINFAVSDAIQQNASDIHFEPEERGLSVRYRIDGALQTRLTPSNEVTAQLLTRLKVMAKLDIAEKRLPQDGRIKMRLGGKTIDFRVSTLPTVTGERIVLRILDKGNIVLGLDKICMPDALLTQFREAIDYPEGIILVTGPTGSGKTTTLYSALSELKKDDTNIMTIEDPVEYRLKGIAQIGVHPKIGLSFAAGLRHILRQDPDIIMIGEIRDKETAEIAIQSALTGHLVLSTLHTNDAPSAIIRLVDMGIEPYLLSSCVIGVLAQRLVRKICPHCKTAFVPSPSEIASIGLNIQQLYRGIGCDHCLGTGYKGRQGIYELMPMSTQIKKQLLTSPEATQISQVALNMGMKTLRDHGKLLVQAGVTTWSEVWRATKAHDEERGG